MAVTTANNYYRMPTAAPGLLDAQQMIEAAFGPLRAKLNPTATSQQAKLDPLTGLWKDKTTGNVWTGSVINPDGTTAQTQNGKVLPQDTYGNTLPVFTAQTTPKQPEIVAAAGGLMAEAKSFNDYLKQAKDDYLAQAKTLNAESAVQLKTDQAAVDPTATINRLNTGAAATTATLDATNKDYAAKQAGVLGEVATENTAAAQTTADRLAKLKSDLDSQNAQYESAAQAVAGQAYDRAKQQISLYQLNSGTPTSGSGDLSNRYLKSYAAINVPLQADLAQRRYAQTGALDAQQQVADQSAYQNLISYYAGESSLNSDVANRLGETAKYTGNLDATTALQIQQLKTATAGMSRAMAAQYLQQLAVPFAVGAQVLAGEVSNLAGIQGITTGANYYNINTPYDPSRVPVTTTNPASAPGRNNYPSAAAAAAATPAAVTTTGTGGAVQPVGQTTAAYDASGNLVYVDTIGNQFNGNGQLIYTSTPAQRAAQANNYQVQVPAATAAGVAASIAAGPVSAPLTANDWLAGQGAY